MITKVQLGTNTLTSTQILLQAVRSAAFPAVVYTKTKRGGFHGQRLVSPTFAGYKIEMEWKIIGTTFSDFASQRENFANMIGQIHSQGVQTLILTKSNGTSVQLDIKAVDMFGDMDTEGCTSGTFLTEMESEYPFMQGTTLKTQDVLIFNGGGFAVPMGVPFNMSVGVANTVSLMNAGNYFAYPILTFVGKLTNPTFTNTSTGKQVSLNYSLADNTASIVVDTYFHTVVLQPSGTNARQYFSGDFLTLQPGTNVLQLGNANTTDGGKCTVTYRDHWLGV